jgi:hypothetical protein
MIYMQTKGCASRSLPPDAEERLGVVSSICWNIRQRASYRNSDDDLCPDANVAGEVTRSNLKIEMSGPEFKPTLVSITFLYHFDHMLIPWMRCANISLGKGSPEVAVRDT